MMNDKTPSVALQMKPWSVPNFATINMPQRLKQDGMNALPTLHVRELPVETLDALAEQWRLDLYNNAGQMLPEERK